MKFAEKRKRRTNPEEENSYENLDDYTKHFNEQYQKELKLLYDHTKRQYLMTDEEFESSTNTVPWRKYSSLDPALQFRLDNARCECGNCHLFSGTKDKNCWVFNQLGCDFSTAARKFFHCQRSDGEKCIPIFNIQSREQQVPLLLKNQAFFT